MADAVPPLSAIAGARFGAAPAHPLTTIPPLGWSTWPDM